MVGPCFDPEILGGVFNVALSLLGVHVLLRIFRGGQGFALFGLKFEGLPPFGCFWHLPLWVLLHLSKEQLSKGTFVQGTLVQEDFCLRRLLFKVKIWNMYGCSYNFLLYFTELLKLQKVLFLIFWFQGIYTRVILGNGFL